MHAHMQVHQIVSYMCRLKGQQQSNIAMYNSTRYTKTHTTAPYNRKKFKN